MRRRGSGRHANRRLVGRQRTPKHHDNADKTKEGARRESPIQFSLSMLSTLVVALFILTFNVQAFEIPTGSMEPTLLVGDHVLVDRADSNSVSVWCHSCLIIGLGTVTFWCFYRRLNPSSTWSNASLVYPGIISV